MGGLEQGGRPGGAPPVLVPEPILFPRHQHKIRIFSYVAAAVTSVYCVFFHDFGEREHCFMPIRRYTQSALEGFFSLSDEERRKADQLRSQAPTGAGPAVPSSPPAAASADAESEGTRGG